MRLRGFVCVVLILCLTASSTVFAETPRLPAQECDAAAKGPVGADRLSRGSAPPDTTQTAGLGAGNQAEAIVAHPSDDTELPSEDAPSDAASAGERANDSAALPLPALAEAIAPHIGREARPLPERQTPRNRTRLEEIPGLRTANSRHFRNSDGTITADIYATPVNYLDENEGWQEIDPTPRRGVDKEGRLAGYAVDHTPVRLALPARADGPITLRAKGGRRLQLTAPDAAAVQGEVEGSKVVYPDAWPGVDLVEESQPTGLKETLVLKGLDVPESYSFTLSLSGVGSCSETGITGGLPEAAADTARATAWARPTSAPCPQRARVLAGDPGLDLGKVSAGNAEKTVEDRFRPERRDDGSWVVLDNRTGDPLFTLPAPYLEDASGQTVEAYLDVVLRDGIFLVTVGFDPSWLGDPARTFPVRLDPTVNLQSSIPDTYVDSATLDTNYATSSYLRVKRLTGGEMAQAYVGWDVSSIPTTATVMSASVSLRVASTTASATVAIASAAGDWAADQLTWRNQPGHLDQSVALALPGTSGTRTWDITGLFALWARELSPYHGVVVYPVTNVSLMSFCSSEYPTATSRPKLSVTYTSGTDGAGLESYWATFGRDLGNGWSATINLASGNLVLQKTLYAISGLGPTMSEGLVYNQVARGTDVGLGRGWRFASDVRLNVAEGGSYAEVTDEDGTVLRYLSDGAGGYTLPPGVFRKIGSAGDPVQVEVAPGEFQGLGACEWKLTDKARNDYRFDGDARIGVALTCIVDSDGHALALLRDASGRIVKQRGTSGRELNYTYGPGENGPEVTISDPARDAEGQPTHTYTLDCGEDGSGNADLVRVVAPDGARVEFSYGDYGLASFTDGRGMVTEFAYDDSGRPTAIIGPYDPAFTDPRPETDIETAIGVDLITVRTTTTMLATPEELTSWVDYEIDPVTWNPLARTDALGNRTSWTWEADLKTKEVDPLGSGAVGIR